MSSFNKPFSLSAGIIENSHIAAATIGSEKLQSGTDEEDWVLGRVSDCALGDVGSLAACKIASGTCSSGATIAGSALRYTTYSGASALGTPAGTWRSMGYDVPFAGASLFMRVS